MYRLKGKNSVEIYKNLFFLTNRCKENLNIAIVQIALMSLKSKNSVRSDCLYWEVSSSDWEGRSNVSK